MTGSTSRFCTSCGRSNAAGGNFCELCGTDLRLDSLVVAADQPTATAISASPPPPIPPPPPPPPPPISLSKAAPAPWNPPAPATPADAAGTRWSRNAVIPVLLLAVVAGCLGAWWWLSGTSGDGIGSATPGSAAAADTNTQPKPKPRPTATGVYSGKMYGVSHTYDFTMTLKEKADGTVTGEVFEQQIGGNACSGTEVVEGTRTGRTITLDGTYFTSDSACYSRWSGYEDDFELRLSDNGERIEGRFWCYACSTTGPFSMSGTRR